MTNSVVEVYNCSQKHKVTHGVWGFESDDSLFEIEVFTGIRPLHSSTDQLSHYYRSAACSSLVQPHQRIVCWICYILALTGTLSTPEEGNVFLTDSDDCSNGCFTWVKASTCCFLWSTAGTTFHPNGKVSVDVALCGDNEVIIGMEKLSGIAN